MTQLEPASKIDPFLYRLAAAAPAGISLLATVSGIYFVLRGGPQLRAVLADIDKRLDMNSEWTLRYHWFSLSVAVAAFVASVLAILRPGRALVSLAYFMTFIAVVARFVANYALYARFDSLLQSLTGVR